MRPPLVAMSWRDALFLHWPVDPQTIRSAIPRGLDVDTYDGAAWIGIIAFRIAAARPAGMPEAFGLPAFGEVNVRTYVRGPQKAGVWFFSLDADSALTVAAGRRVVRLPYLRASVTSDASDTTLSYRCVRHDRRAPAAVLDVRAHFGDGAPPAVAGSLASWLAERYCFYTADNRGALFRGDVEHAPWPLLAATAEIAENTLLRAAGITPASPEPLVHASPGVRTRAWPLARLP